MTKSSAKLLRQLDAHFKSVQDFLESKRDLLKDEAYDARYLPFEEKLWKTVHNTFFSLVTGEPDWNKFYDRFGTGHDKKPNAWEGTYIPDQMSNLIWNGAHADLKYRVSQVQALYEKCRKIENDYLKSGSYDRKNR